MKVIMGGVFGGITGFVIARITGYKWTDWRVYAWIAPIFISGVIYAFTPF